MRAFFSSLAVCWLFCLVIVTLFSLLDHFASQKGTPHLLYHGPVYMKVIQFQSYRDIKTSEDMHEVFLAVITSSYELWTNFLNEVLAISITYELFPFVFNVVSTVVPNMIYKIISTLIIEPYQRWTEIPMPG